ncbi:AMP-binding protein [Phenylobacterium sp. LjRoot164]|uniref:AMP-binding protein n=1 Tax=Phenylobacterium sp. LjRoot164 TaxID=3342272 RepID=UPI003ED16563
MSAGDVARAIGLIALARLTDVDRQYVALGGDERGRDLLSIGVDEARSLGEQAQAVAIARRTPTGDDASPRLALDVRTGGSAPSDAEGGFDLRLEFDLAASPGTVSVFHAAGVSPSRASAIAELLVALTGRLCASPSVPTAQTRSSALATPGALPDPTATLTIGGTELVHTAFLRTARDTPQAIALRHGRLAYSYAQVEARSRDVAARLHASGVGRGDRVAIIAERGPALIWAILGVLRLGGVFVVLDSAYPEQRLAELAAIAAVGAVIGAADGEDVKALAARIAASRSVPIVYPGRELLSKGEGAGLDAAEPTDPAYLLFTSGSTGVPKCVAVGHRPLVNFVTWQAARFELGASDRFTMLSGLSHDPLLRDVFTPLSLGACLMIPEQRAIFEPGGLRRWFEDVRPTTAHMTPAMGQLLCAGAKAEAFPGLRHVFWGGDLLRPALLTEIARVAPNAVNVNFYGSTETPQAAGYFVFDGDFGWKTVPVGQGSGGFQLLIVDRDRQLKGIGEVGEIAVRSNLLSLGYVVGGEIQASTSGDSYYTGDRGFYLPSGDVVVLGRQDDQIKIRGYRVDLSEITAALLAHRDVRSAIALAEGGAGAPRIAAFVTSDRSDANLQQDILQFLAERLPSYMSPSSLVRLEAMPLLPNGKIDRMALRASTSPAEPPPEPAGRAAGSPKERALVEKWSSVLGRRDIAPGSSFVSIGGDSLSYVQLYLATEEVLGVVPDGWHLMALRDIAATAAPAKRFFSDVDTSMIIRAVSIALVVAGHFALLDYGGGATSALFLVSGFMIGGHQLWEVFEKKSAKPILKMLLNVTIPVALFSYALFFAKVLAGQEASWSLAFFYKNFLAYTPSEKQFFLWYIHCMMQMLAILYLSVLLMGQRRLEPDRKWSFLAASFAIACVFRFVVPFLIYPDYPEATSDPLLVVNLLPTTHYATLILGAMAACADTPRRRLAAMVSALAYAAATYFTLEVMSWLFILASAFTLLFVRRLPVLKPFGRAIFLLSGGSLFIYLTHYHVRVVLNAVGAPNWPLLQVACALVGGILVWVAWNKAQAVSARLRSSAPVAVEAAG